MDFWSWILLIAIAIVILAAIIALVAFAVSVWGKYRAIETTRYERRLTAEKEFDKTHIDAAKVLVVGKMAFVVKSIDVDGSIIYDRMPVDSDGSPITTDTIDGKAVDQHKIASKLVDDSIRFNGSSSTQLLSSRQWEGMGNTEQAHKEALEYLSRIGLISIKNGGRDQGTYVKEGNLQRLLLDLSVNALPLAMGQPIPKQTDAGTQKDARYTT